MNILVDILREAEDPSSPALTRSLRTQLTNWAELRHIDIDAQTFAEWGADMLKLDGAMRSWTNGPAVLLTFIGCSL